MTSLPPAALPPELVAALSGTYELLQEIGRGGMGVVYRARDTESGDEVALKVVLSRGSVTPHDAARLRHEALLAARVKHPGIVAVLDAGEAEGLPYVAMALAQMAKDLADEAGVRIRAELAEIGQATCRP